MCTYVIIPSGGSGVRSGLPLPKQYHKFHGMELIAYTIQAFQNSSHIDKIIISAQEEFFPLLRQIQDKYSFTKIQKLIPGGSERQFSVMNALTAFDYTNDDIILVHDAVRPNISQDIINEAVKSASVHGSAVVAIRAKDTLIKGNEAVGDYIDRSEIFYAQTPQAFRFPIIKEAMDIAQKNNFIGTDESMLVHRAGFKVYIVEGSSLNFKVTSKDDVKLFDIISENKLK